MLIAMVVAMAGMAIRTPAPTTAAARVARCVHLEKTMRAKLNSYVLRRNSPRTSVPYGVKTANAVTSVNKLDMSPYNALNATTRENRAVWLRLRYAIASLQMASPRSQHTVPTSKLRTVFLRRTRCSWS